MTVQRTITLITGSNRSLGYTAAQRLIAQGHEVYVTARDPAKTAAPPKCLGPKF